jgi:hypothetical protein
MGHVARIGEMWNAYKILFGKPEGKRPHGRPRSKWEDKIIMVLKQIGWEGVEWFHLAQDVDKWRALVNTEIKNRIP